MVETKTMAGGMLIPPFLATGFGSFARVTLHLPNKKYLWRCFWRSALLLLRISVRIHVEKLKQHVDSFKAADERGGSLARPTPSHC